MLSNERKNDLNFNVLPDKINIKDVMIALCVEDIRTAIKWCKNKSILIFKFGKEKYINSIDFELAVDRPLIKSLKEKHPEHWKEIYAAYKNGDYLKITELLFEPQVISKTKFVAPGTSGNKFIEKLNKKSK
jgi:hypothetical protein